MIDRRSLMDFLAPVLLPILCAGFLGQAGCTSQQGPTQKITIGTNLNDMNGLLFIAKTRGFDKQYGLDLTIKPFGTGRDAAREVIAGRLDFACCAEFALVNEIFAGADKLRCLAALSSGDIHALIARRDKEVAQPEDLRGKTIGAPLGTSGEFYLGRYLTFNNIPLNEVTIIDVNPPDHADTLAAGRIDAVLTWEPVTYDILKRLGDNAIQWPAQEGQDFYWLLVSRQDVIKNKMVVLEKLFRALTQAANFAREKPEEVRRIITQWTKVPLADLQAGRFPVMYDLFLDQAMLFSMEDQARWMIRNRLTEHRRVPNYLNYIDADALAKINPKAVRLIIPKGRNRDLPDSSGREEVNK